MTRKHKRTNSSDLTAAYRAAGRHHEADTTERTDRASSQPDLASELLDSFRRLKALQDQARSRGIFTEDRDLLECDSCGLQEDVLSTGVLVTRQAGEPDAPDTGLRFQEISPNVFACPRCAQKVVIAEEPFDSGEDSLDAQQP
jgi:hypothetical protein